MAAYSFSSAGSERTTSGSSYVTSLTPVLPAGTAAGDLLFLYAKGSHNTVSQRWAPPSGWTEVGAAVTGDTGSGQRYNSLQLWAKVAGASEPNPTVTVTTSAGSGGLRAWYTNMYRYIPSTSPAPSDFAYVVACNDMSAASSYSGRTIAPNRDATAIVLVASAGAGGALTATTANGFTRQSATTGTPTSVLYDKAVTAGTVSLPDFPAPASSYLTKEFAIDRQLVTIGWLAQRNAIIPSNAATPGWS